MYLGKCNRRAASDRQREPVWSRDLGRRRQAESRERVTCMPTTRVTMLLQKHRGGQMRVAVHMPSMCALGPAGLLFQRPWPGFSLAWLIAHHGSTHTSPVLHNTAQSMWAIIRGPSIVINACVFLLASCDKLHPAGLAFVSDANPNPKPCTCP